MQELLTEPLRCWIYRSSKRDEMYLYLVEEQGFDTVPEALIRMFGQPVRVMELKLSLARPLAREDVAQVLHNLRTQGFHLQMPPGIVPESPNA